MHDALFRDRYAGANVALAALAAKRKRRRAAQTALAFGYGPDFSICRYGAIDANAGLVMYNRQARDGGASPTWAGKPACVYCGIARLP